MTDTIDMAEIDLDVIDADGEIPARTIATLHLHGDFQATCESYLGIDGPDGKGNDKLVFILNDVVANELYYELEKILRG